MSSRKGRTRRERLNADNLKAQRRQPCAACGQRIDYSLPVDDPEAFNAGHKGSWIDFPHLREDPSNLRPEHASCNKSHGRSDAEVIGSTSRQW